MKHKKSYLINAMTRDGSARIICTDTSEIVEEVIKIHNLARTSAAALGRTLTAASIMGYMLKDDKSTITLQIKGDGPIGTICCVSDYMGNVRGYCDHPDTELAPNAQHKIDVAGAVGNGTVYVIRDLGLETPYIGQSPIVSGEIAEDITEYFAKSEQTPTVCALGVRVNRDGSCKSSGGFIMQLLPFADEAIVPKLEENISKIESVSALIADGLSCEDIIAKVFDGIEYDLFEPVNTSYKCTCSRDRYYRAIKGLSKDDMDKIKESDEPIEACCQFCGKKYIFELSEFK